MFISEDGWISENGIQYKIVDGLLSLKLPHYEANRFIERLGFLIRSITHSPELKCESFAEIHRLSRIAHEILSSMSVTSLDKTDCNLLYRVKQDPSLHKIFDITNKMGDSLRILSTSDIIGAHELVANINWVMES